MITRINPYEQDRIRLSKNGLDLKFYQGIPFAECRLCHKQLFNIKSIYSHKQICKEHHRTRKDETHKQNVLLMNTVLFLCDKHISINAVTTSQYYQNIIQMASNFAININLITKKYVRNTILNFSNFLFEPITVEKFGKFISILLDGSRKGSREFYILMLFTRNCLIFGNIFEVNKTDVKSLVDTIKPYIYYLIEHKQFTICSACSDNAANMLQLFRNYDEISIQSNLGTFFLHIQCICHIFSLIIKEYCVAGCCLLVQILNTASFLRKKMKNVPIFIETRWGSLNEVILFLTNPNNLLEINIIIQNSIDEYTKCNEKYLQKKKMSERMKKTMIQI